MCRVYKLSLRRWFLWFVVSSHTRRRLRSILVRAQTRRNQRMRAKIVRAWAQAAASHAQLSGHRRWKSRELHNLGLDVGGMFESGEVAVVAKALAQQARIESLTTAKPRTSFLSGAAVPGRQQGTMDRIEEERHARVAILQSEHRIILDQLRTVAPSTGIATESDSLRNSIPELDVAARRSGGIVEESMH